MRSTTRGMRTGADVDVRHVRVEGLDLRTWTFEGDAPGPARDVVLVHGLGTSAATFERIVPHLVGTRTVHALELPGFARVPHPDGGLTVGDLARLVTSWVERTGLERPTLVGHSMGTQVVVEAAAAAPGLVSDVVLVGPTTDTAARTVPRQLARLLRSAARESPRANAVVLRGYLECGPGWYLAELRHMLGHAMERRLPLVDVPVLVVRGEHDRVAPTAWVDLLAAAAPHGRSVTVPGAAHVTMYSHPEDVAELVLAHVVR